MVNRLNEALHECTQLTLLESTMPLVLHADDEERSWPIEWPTICFADGMSMQQRSTALARFLTSSPRVLGVRARFNHQFHERELDWRLLARLMPEQARRRTLKLVYYNEVRLLVILVTLQHQRDARIDGVTLTQLLRDFPNLRSLSIGGTRTTLDDLTTFVEHALRVFHQLAVRLNAVDLSVTLDCATPIQATRT